LDPTLISNYALLKQAVKDCEVYCVLDAAGTVVLSSDEFIHLLSEGSSSITSLFQFNPEYSFLDWRSRVEQLDTKTALTLQSKMLLPDNSIREVNIELIKFLLEKREYILYKVLLPAAEVHLQSATTEPEKESSHQADSAYSYDENAPNPVLYFDHKGQIHFANELMKYYNDHHSRFDNVTDLFLESEFGDLVAGLEDYNTQKTEVIIRLIMKSAHGMKDGYGRFSYHPNQDPTRYYRMEFLFSEGMNLQDDPLQKAMIELDRLKSEAIEKKTILVSDTSQDFTFNSIVTKSTKYKSILEQVAMVADTAANVLIIGKTGTGKELLSNAVYKLSDRSDELFVKINCATIPPELFESTLFGHEKGSFTGAHQKKIGKFELADGGTIFLDEIGELPIEMQAKLLRVLQEGEIERIGNPEPIKVDVRIIAATNRDLAAMVQKNKFRQDLYYRLNVFPIYNMPLRERKEDIPLLIDHFLNKMNKKMGRSVTTLKNKDLNYLLGYDFPGNVRELENMIERAVVLSSGETANFDFLNVSNRNPGNQKTFSTFEEMVKNHIEKALRLANGKITGTNSAAEYLNMNGKTLASKMVKYNIDKNKFRSG